MSQQRCSSAPAAGIVDTATCGYGGRRQRCYLVAAGLEPDAALLPGASGAAIDEAAARAEPSSVAAVEPFADAAAEAEEVEETAGDEEADAGLTEGSALTALAAPVAAAGAEPGEIRKPSNDTADAADAGAPGGVTGTALGAATDCALAACRGMGALTAPTSGTGADIGAALRAASDFAAPDGGTATGVEAPLAADACASDGVTTGVDAAAADAGACEDCGGGRLPVADVPAVES